MMRRILNDNIPKDELQTLMKFCIYSIRNAKLFLSGCFILIVSLFSNSIKADRGNIIYVSSDAVIVNKEYIFHEETPSNNNVSKDSSLVYIADNSTIIEAANKVLLDILLVYDESKERKTEILCAAKSLAEWILELNNTETAQLNLLQTIRRERQFTKEEKEILLSIALDNQNKKEILFGANLLLDNQELAAKYFEQLDFTYQEQYKQYPIYKFKKV